jgi:hypothetical protein
MFKKSYSIPRIHTLCYLLKKMYYKYGFRYFDDENNQNVVNNKIILSNMKTHNLRFDLFIGYVYDKIKLEFLEDGLIKKMSKAIEVISPECGDEQSESKNSIVSDKILILLKDVQIIYSNNYNGLITEMSKANRSY